MSGGEGGKLLIDGTKGVMVELVIAYVEVALVPSAAMGLEIIIVTTLLSAARLVEDEAARTTWFTTDPA